MYSFHKYLNCKTDCDSDSQKVWLGSLLCFHSYLLQDSLFYSVLHSTNGFLSSLCMYESSNGVLSSLWRNVTFQLLLY
ncbi:hypothetical protein PHAVU_003G002900 [Phaseolus vulgaris]|uniref:Uncharacterized protein n=1 Tax=Phaseolus vulgaris TaxID=3885 RepID=V7C810_PHAVU|nr:hypothetical protein PHAVU_003G002900g [Phaseolus vulgaris]ESW25051.1 hypothetical protein PHAVU_003G002900g [Phaseolus vulgaris]